MLQLYSGNNSQQLTLYGVQDDAGNPITGAAITGSITQYGVQVGGGGLTFTDVAGQAGNYSALLDGFDPPLRPTMLEIDGTVPSGDMFSLEIPCTVTPRTL